MLRLSLTLVFNATQSRTEKTAKLQPEHESRVCGVDAAPILRLHGRKSLLAVAESRSAETTALPYYADVILGTEKKEKLVSAKRAE